MGIGSAGELLSYHFQFAPDCRNCSTAVTIFFMTYQPLWIQVTSTADYLLVRNPLRWGYYWQIEGIR
ncbi:MAG: hypothetical protein QOI54_720 [Actinomycetota bacterium]|jgi:hypothetical protein|nr:hypothetical protein [Actinomycetota bacterium]